MVREEELRAIVKNFIDGKQHWVLLALPYSWGAAELALKIEQTYYPAGTPAQCDIFAAMLPSPIGSIGVFIYGKRRMTPAQLWELLKDAGQSRSMSIEDLDFGKDILCPVEPESAGGPPEWVMSSFTRWFGDWLQQPCDLKVDVQQAA